MLDGFQDDEHVQAERPIFEVVEIGLDALPDVRFGKNFAAISVDLRPAGDAGANEPANEIIPRRL